MDSSCVVILFILLLLILFGLIFKKSKLMFLINSITLIILTCGYNGHIDLPYYEKEYYSHFISKSPFEKVYEYLCIYFDNHNVSFETFHFWISFFSLIIILYVIYKMTDAPGYCSSLMIGFATFEYAWQIKTLTASALIVFATYIFFKDIKSKFNQLVFVLLIILASGFHFFAIAFLLLLALPYIKLKILKKEIWLFILIASVFINQIMQYAYQVISALGTYMNMLSVRTFILSTFWHIASVVLCYFMVRTIEIENDVMILDNLVCKDHYNKIFNIYYGAVILLSIIPFYWFTNVILRYVRVWFIFMIILSSDVKGSFEKGRKGVIKFPSISKEVFILYVEISFLLFYVLFTANNKLLQYYLSDNIFLK